MSVLKFLAIAAAAFTLAGCLGGVGSSTGAPLPAPLPAPPPAPPIATPPGIPSVPSGPLNWAIPAAPSGAIQSITTSGDMAVRLMRFDGQTETVQANVVATATQAQVAFDTSNFLGFNVVFNVTDIHTSAWQTTATHNGNRIFTRLEGRGNAAVVCRTGRTPTLQDTVVLLSHNLRPVTLAHALAHGLASQTFNMVDCTHRFITGSGGHSEWLRFNADGSFSAGTDSNASIPLLTRTRSEVDSLLDSSGLALGTGNVDRAQIYELVIDGSRMFFILQHTFEGGGAQQYVMLGIPN